MRKKSFKKEEILRVIARERLVSMAISITVTLGVSGGTVYGVNKFVTNKLRNGIGNISKNIKDINMESMYRGTIILESEKEELDTQRELATGVKEGFDEYKSSNTQSSGSSSNFSSGGGSSSGVSSSVGGSTANNVVSNVVSIDNSSITGRNVRILEGQEFNPIKSLNLRATDINGKDISDKITIIENTVDIYAPGQYIVKAGAPLSNGSQKEVILTVNVEPTTLNLSVDNLEVVSDSVNKGENAVLALDLSSNKDYLSAVSVNINGVDYPVKKIEARGKSQKYMLELPVGDEHGDIEHKLSSIRMSDNTVVKLNKSVNITVAKEKPVISSFDYEETKEKVKGEKTSEVLMKVELKDKDKALVDEKASIYVYDKDGNTVSSQNISPDKINDVHFTALENGIYTVKVVADLNLTGKISKNEELFVNTIEVTSIDKTDLTGENIKIKLGSDFEPIRDLKIKALDVDGTDITDEVVIEDDEVNVYEPGKYVVKASFINKNNEEIIKEFTVEVAEPMMRRILEINSEDNTNEDLIVNDEESRSMTLSRSGSSRSVSASNSVSGNDTETLNSDLTITGTISDGNGLAPAGRIEVELPTKVTFTVDQAGNFKGTNFNVNNKSGCDVILTVAQFVEGNPGGGITIDNDISDFTKVGRTTVGLKLHGTSNGVNESVKLDNGTSDVDLLTVKSNDSAMLQILGDAGKLTTKDTEGAAEDFTLKFKIRKA